MFYYKTPILHNLYQKYQCLPRNIFLRLNDKFRRISLLIKNKIREISSQYKNVINLCFNEISSKNEFYKYLTNYFPSQCQKYIIEKSILNSLN